jgi:ABC-type multidrug transport system ATPase subunit
VLDYPMVSSYHAQITVSNGTITIEDLQSTNGTAVGNPDNRITTSRIKPDDTIYFGSLPVPAARLLSGKVALGEAPREEVHFSGSAILLGRDPQCQMPLNHPLVSWHHARITRTPAGFIVEDLGSTNGTFVNGQRITGQMAVRPGDMIALGSFSFVLTAEGKLQQRDDRGNVTLEARGITVDVKDRRLIEGISLTIYPSEIVGLMGPSGAGKTTLMNALNGYTPPTFGGVQINGLDLYQNYEQFCGHIGYVPQDDIMHRDLTVGQALYYTARLRLPADFSDSDINSRISRVLKMLGLEGTENVIIGTPEKKGISGGQRKRVNLAMELLTDPSLLFLDEPTSGLSSEDALMVMEALRKLADEGKTIIITIHQPGLEVFRLMDNLIMLAKDKGSIEPGRLAYYGPAYPAAVDFFNPGGVPNLKPGQDPSPDEVMRGLGRGKAADWLRQYIASPYKKQYVDERMGKHPAGAAPVVAPKITREPDLAQWWTLVRRTLAIKLKDKGNTVTLLALAPVIAMLILITMGINASKEGPGDLQPYAKTTYTVFLMIVSAIFLGCWGALREIVSEWAVYHRERMVNLKIPSYVASKFTVLGAILGLVQLPVLFLITYLGSGLQGPWFGMLFVLVLTGLVSLALGLLISATVKTAETATSLSILLMIVMILLAGAIVQTHKRGETARPLTYFIPSRWSFEAMLVMEANARNKFQGTVVEDGRPVTKTIDMAERIFPEEQRAGVILPVIILLWMLAILIAGAGLVLKARDVH